MCLLANRIFVLSSQKQLGIKLQTGSTLFEKTPSHRNRREKFVEGLNSTVKLTLYKCFGREVQFKKYLHGLSDAGTKGKVQERCADVIAYNKTKHHHTIVVAIALSRGAYSAGARSALMRMRTYVMCAY